jgi:hypothetical protein
VFNTRLFDRVLHGLSLAAIQPERRFADDMTAMFCSQESDFSMSGSGRGDGDDAVISTPAARSDRTWPSPDQPVPITTALKVMQNSFGCLLLGQVRSYFIIPGPFQKPVYTIIEY